MVDSATDTPEPQTLEAAMMDSTALPDEQVRPTLFNQADELALIDRLMDEYDDEIQKNEGDLPQELHERLQAALPKFNERLVACGARMKAYEARAQIREAESERLAKSAQATRNRIKSLREYMRICMRIANVTQIKDVGFYDISRQATKPTVRAPELAGADDASMYPVELIRIKPAQDAQYFIDKDAALAWSKSGKPLPGKIEIIPGETVVVR